MQGFSKYRRRAFSFLEYPLVLEMLMCLYYANYESVVATRFATKMIKYWIKNTCISGNIEAVFFKPGTRNVHHKRNKMATGVLFP